MESAWISRGPWMFKKAHTISREAHTDPMVLHTHAVWSCIGTGMDFWNKRFMRAPIGFHKNCVSVLWNPHESLGALWMFFFDGDQCLRLHMNPNNISYCNYCHTEENILGQLFDKRSMTQAFLLFTPEPVGLIPFTSMGRLMAWSKNSDPRRCWYSLSNLKWKQGKSYIRPAMVGCIVGDS